MGKISFVSFAKIVICLGLRGLFGNGYFFRRILGGDQCAC